MEITVENSDDAKKTAKKSVQSGEMMVAAICFITAAIILFAFDLMMYFVTRGQARIPIIVQSAVCVLFLAISLILGFAAIAQKSKLSRRRIIEEVCANTFDEENGKSGQKERTDIDETI